MVKSMFSGIAGLRAHQAKMDVIGNNIANVNTYGYKAGRVTFQESIYQTKSASSSGTDTYGGSNPSQVGYGSQVGTIDLLFSSGAYAPTDSATDCMIDGEGFFIVGPKSEGIDLTAEDAEISQAMTATYMTRVGNFVFDGDGYLCDGNGNVVYGYGMNDDGTTNTDTLVPIRLPYVDESGVIDTSVPPADTSSPMKLNSVSISASGEILGADSDGEIQVVGKIAVANVPNPNALEKSQGPYYTIRQNTGGVLPFEPGEGTTGQIVSYGLEMSNVDLANEFAEMITTQRGFQANTRIITVTDEMLQELVNIKR
ncbi:MAG: flagellar hook-basal body complex protein [Anaerotignum sp.]